MEFNMMAGYGDYNWSVILWLLIGILIFIVVISIVVRKVNKNRNAYRPGQKDEQDVLKKNKIRSELSEENYKKQ